MLGEGGGGSKSITFDSPVETTNLVWLTSPSTGAGEHQPSEKQCPEDAVEEAEGDVLPVTRLYLPRVPMTSCEYRYRTADEADAPHNNLR